MRINAYRDASRLEIILILLYKNPDETTATHYSKKARVPYNVFGAMCPFPK